MAENREYLTRAEENGSISIAEDVVAAIAAAIAEDMGEDVDHIKILSIRRV